MVHVSKALIFFLLLPFLCWSQKSTKRSDFTFQNAELQTAILDIAAKFKLDLIFDPSYFEDESPITIDLTDLHVEACLDGLLKSSSIEYEVAGSEILLKKYRTVYGYVRNGYDHESLVGANVFDDVSSTGVSSNDHGYFSFRLPYEVNAVKVSYIGFEDQVLDLRKTEFPAYISLKAEEFIDQVIIIPTDEEHFLSVTPEENNLLTKSINTRLSTGGEPDINQFLYSQTGVNSGPDGIGGLHVRGGNIDQNLMLLDGVRVFQPNHAFGLFSIFNTSLLNSAKFSKYNFHPKNAGGVSSVIDMKLNDGSTKKWGGNFSVSTLATQLNINGPIIKDRTSILISGRKSHINPLLNLMSRFRETEDNYEVLDQYDFYDLNFKVSHKFNSKNRLFISHYNGKDDYQNTSYFSFEDDEVRVRDSVQFNLAYKNSVSALRFNRIYGPKLFSNSILSFSQYRYRSKSLANANIVFESEGFDDTFKADLNFLSAVNDMNLRHDMEYFMNDKALLSFGSYLSISDFKPGAFNDEYETRFSENGVEDYAKDVVEFLSHTFRTNQLGLYYNSDVFLSQYFIVQAGFNYSLLHSRNQTTEVNSYYHLLQARLAFRSEVNNQFSLQLAVDKNQQPFHLLTTSNIGFPNDLWVPAFADRRPQNVYQSNLLASYKPTPSLSIKTSVFIKYLSNLIRYPNEFTLPNLTDRYSEDWESQTIVGDGLGRGLEVDISYETKRMNVNFAYTWSSYDRAFDTLQNGESFPFLFDQNHNLSLNVKFKFSKHIYAYGQFQYSQGTKQSLYESTRYSPLESNVNNVFFAELRSPINGHRLPDYHRLDLGFIFELGKKKSHQIVIGAQNVYNRKNVYFQYYRIKDQVLEENSEIEEGITSVAALPIMPTLRYSFDF